MSYDLDKILNQPLAALEDNGFSTRVITEAAASRRREALLDAALPFLGLALLLPFLPLRELGEAMMRITPTLANSAPLGFAIAALILTFSFERRLFE